VEKFNDVFLWVGGVVATGSSFLLNRMWKSIDLSHSRIDKIENKVVCREHLESQLIPIRQDVNMILKHLLKHRETENKNKE
jgi:hypothetical protein